MRKTLAILFISTVLVIAQNKYSQLQTVANANFNGSADVDNQSHVFGNNFQIQTQIENNDTNENKERTQEMVNNNKFTAKGTITASTSTSLTINNRIINLDSAVTGNVKIVGNVQVGSYAMVQGIIQNSNYYANKIIVDQRNKNETNEVNENTTPAPTKTQNPTIDEFQNANSTLSAGLNFGDIINALQNLLNNLISFTSKV